MGQTTYYSALGGPAKSPLNRTVLAAICGMVFGVLMMYMAYVFVIDPASGDGTDAVLTRSSKFLKLKGGKNAEVEDVDLYLGVKPPAHVTESLPEGYARLFHLLHRRSYECKDLRKIGGNPNLAGDGEWNICFDFFEHLDPKSCAVYSFGINNDFSFDDHIAKATGCEVNSFDPSMGITAFKRGEKKYFYDIGLGSESTDSFTFGDKYSMGTKGTVWKMRTLGDLMKELGTKDIAVLKVDIEYGEWAAIDEMLKDGTLDHIDQFVFEVHFWADRESGRPDHHEVLNKWIRILDAMEKKGFRNYGIHTNPMSTLVFC
ncbi:Methyltransferase-like protein 24 [Quaeritorhiza haematococci]|nr:Methyltransferase-like protein 24 [Quaeritorhiza haematococci]